MKPSVSTSTRLSAAIMFWTGVLCLVQSSHGEPHFRASKHPFAARLHRIDLPADQPQNWPRDVRQFQPVARDDFERWLRRSEAVTDKPASARITSARYTATFAGAALREGRLEWDVRNVRAASPLVPLGDFNVALHDLTWTHDAPRLARPKPSPGDSADPLPSALKPENASASLPESPSSSKGKTGESAPSTGTASANMPVTRRAVTSKDVIWGTDANRRSWLLSEHRPAGERTNSDDAASLSEAASSLTGVWSAVGRALPDEVDFDLHFPPATVTTLELRLPRDRIMRSSAEVARVTEGSDNQWQVWRLHLGGETSCRLSIAAAATTDERKPTIVYDQELAAVVREEDLRFQTLFQVEVFDTPVRELTFAVPPGIEVYAVTYGNDTSLTWRRSDVANREGQITIKLPDPLIGRSRPLRIDGLAVRLPRQPTASPQISIVDGVFSSSRHTLSVIAPLQVHSLRTQGFRQHGPLMPSAEGEVFTFHQLVPVAQLVLDVRRPLAELSAQVTSLLETGEESWTLTSEIAWTSPGGGVFQTNCLIPAEWDLTDVQLVPDQTEARLAGWDVQPQTGGMSLVTIEFLESLAPAKPRRVRLLARRKPPAVGSSFAIPAPQPNNCDSVETTVGLVVPATLAPLLSEDARLERASRPDARHLERFDDQDVFLQEPKRGQQAFWYRSDTSEITGSMQLIPRVRPVTATSDVVVEAAPVEYRERFRIVCRSEGLPVDRLLVYLTQPGGDIRWTLLPARGVAVDSAVPPQATDLLPQRIAPSEHAEWNLPITGELWELKLPPFPSQSFEIIGSRGSRWSTVTKPALVLLPQSTNRRGRVILRRPHSLELQIEQRGLELQPVSDLPSPTNGPNAGKRSESGDSNTAGSNTTGETSRQKGTPDPKEQPEPKEAHPVPSTKSDGVAANSVPANGPSSGDSIESTIWSYGTAADELTLELKAQQATRDFPAMVSLHLRSLLSADSSGYDLYRARIRIENGSAQNELRIRLPSPALLQQVLINGEVTLPNRQGEEILIPGLSAARRDVVELLYRVPSQSRLIRDVRSIMVPQLDATVLGMDWEFAFPPSIQLHNEPRGVRLLKPLVQPTWTERLFGPLGRPRQEEMFNPLLLGHWANLVQPPEKTTASVGDIGDELAAPVEWQVHRAVTPVVPGRLQIELWHATRVRLISWIVLGGTLFCGMVMRMTGWSHRARAAAYWLTFLVSMAVCGPSPYCEFAGGAIAGTIISMLIPRQLIIPERRKEQADVPHGSTQSFHLKEAGGLLGVIGSLTALTAWSCTGIAQEPTGGGVRPKSNVIGTDDLRTEGQRTPKASPDDEPKEKRHTVYVPVDRDGRPAANLPLVYVSPALATLMKEPIVEQDVRPATLIASARYDATLSEGSSLSVKAAYRVYVLDTSREQSLEIALSDSVLTGAGAVRVNGVPQSVTMGTDTRTVVIGLPSNAEKTDADQKTGSSGSSSRPGWFDVELDLRRVANRTSQGGSLTTSLPPVADSRFSLAPVEQPEFVDVGGSRGAFAVAPIAPGSPSSRIEIDAGGSSRIDLRWGKKPSESRPSRVEVSLLQKLELQPSFSELQVRIKCDPLDGPVSFLDIDLPTGTLLREGDIAAENLLRIKTFSDKDGIVRLRLIFTEPQRDEFVVRATMMVPLAGSAVERGLPQISVSNTSAIRPIVDQNWWWITAPFEYRADARQLDLDPGTAVSTDEFAHDWEGLTTLGRPLFVFQPREGASPTFTLVPQTVRRRALEWNQVGRVGKRRLEWQLSARIETTQSPVHQHALLIDGRLQIESISVRENGADRLLRWAESGGTSNAPKRIVLFLRDQTSGEQHLTLKASLPFSQGKEVRLPFVRCEEAEVVQSKWSLFRDAEVDVELKLPRGVPPFEAGGEVAEAEGMVPVAQYHIADPDPKTSMIVSARHSRCHARTIAILTRTDGKTWKLSGRSWLTPLGDSPRRLGVNFPASAYEPVRIEIPPSQAEATWHDPEGGIRRLDLTLPPDPLDVSFPFEAVLEEPTGGDWSLALPVPLQATLHEMSLVVTPPDVWTPLAGTELKSDETPGWATDYLDEHRPTGTVVEYSISTVPVQLRRAAATQVDEPFVRLIDHQLWLTREGTVHGVTRAYLSHSRDAIEFDVPAGFEPMALFLDNRPLPIAVPANNQMKIPVVGGGRESILDIIWKRPSSGWKWVVQQDQHELPHPNHARVSKVVSSAIPHRDIWVFARREVTPLNWFDAALDHLEMLLERQRSLGGDDRAAAANRILIDQVQSRMTSQLEQEGTSTDRSPVGQRATTNQQATRLKRWSELTNMANQLSPAIDASAAEVETGPASLFDELSVNHPVIVRGSISVENPSADYWLLDRRWLLAALALFLSLVAIPFLRYAIRVEWGPWLHEHATISWLALGVLWWMYMTPGALGPIVMVVAITRSAILRIRSFRHGPDHSM